MSAVAAMGTATEAVVDKSHVRSVSHIDASEIDDLNSDYEAFMQEINDIVGEFGCANDDEDELDEYIDQLVDVDVDYGEPFSQQAHESDVNGELPSTQLCSSSDLPNGVNAESTNEAVSPIGNTTATEEKEVEGYDDQIVSHLTPSTTDYSALIEEARQRADEEYALRMRLQRQFREEREALKMGLEQLQATNSTFADHLKQIEMELSSAWSQRNSFEQQLLDQTKELEELVTEKNCLSVKLQVLRENSIPLSKAKVLCSENKRLTADLETVKRRAVEAEVGIYMLKQRYETDGLKRSLSDVQKTLETLRKIIDDIGTMARTDVEKADLRDFLNAERSWVGIYAEIERVLEEVTAEFDQYIAMIRGGTPLADLPPIRIPNRPRPPLTPTCPSWIAERRLELQRSSRQSTITSPPPGFDSVRSLAHFHQVSPMTVTNGHSSPHRASGEEGHHSQQPTTPSKPRTQALFDGVAALVPNTTRNEIAEAIHKAREALPQGFRALGLTGAIQRVADTVVEQRRIREQTASAPATPRRTVAQPQPVRLINGHQPPSTAEIASATVPTRKEPPAPAPVETAAEKVSFFDAPKDDDCTICHEPFRRQVDLQRCRVCHTVFHHSCLKTWLRLKKTCPICNRHMLLDEEFPAL